MNLGVEAVLPLCIFAVFVQAVWVILSMISRRNSASEVRLARLCPQGPLMKKRMREQRLANKRARKLEKRKRFEALVERAKALSGPLIPNNPLEQDRLKLQLANAGFRRDSAVLVYLGLRVLTLLSTLLLSAAIFLPMYGVTLAALKWMVLLSGLGFYVPPLVLWYLRRRRQQLIYHSLPDVLDMLVVCVESGLGLDLALRYVGDGMKSIAPVLHDELALANFQLQAGRPRRDVLYDLGLRTGVDDVRSLAAILIQSDRFGCSIARALRVQSDSMRLRRRQDAEERAAKTAVQLIFPLILFIFPGIFVVLCGPAVITIGAAWPMSGEW